MIHELNNPIACTTPLGDAYIWYIKPNGYLENDEITCILMNGGQVRHFTTDQIRIWNNQTYKINKDEKFARCNDSLH
jgi:hypothetical protein